MTSDYLIQALGHYRLYHQDPTNVLIHQITVPIIIVTLLSLFQRRWNFSSTWLLIAYANYYYSLNPTLGLDWVVYFGLPCYLISIWWTSRVSLNSTLTLHCLAWLIQVTIGHGVYEGRRPAFIEGLFEAITISPLFVFMEFIS